MLASAIRELAAPKHLNLISAAYFESTVQIWDVNSQAILTEFPTVFCSGAKNLAFSPEGEILIAGKSLHNGRVAAYEISSGKMLWERSKLVYPSYLRFHPNGQSILCTSNEGSTVLRLDVQTGDTLEVLSSIRHYLEGPFGDTLTVPSKDARQKSVPLRLSSKGHEFDIYQLNFAILDVSFSPVSVCLSEARGLVRCFSCYDGSLQWKFEPSESSHITHLHYSERSEVFFGVLWDFAKGSSRNLIRFDTHSGKHERVCELDSWEEVFLSTDQLVTSAGEIIDLTNGNTISQLSFPVKQYPGD